MQLKYLAILPALALAFTAVPALAATFTNAEFDGEVSVEGKAKTTEQVTLRIVVEEDEQVEFIQTDVISDGLSPVCHNVRDLDEGTYLVDLNVKLPPNVRYYDLEVDAYGIFGTFTSNGCDEANNLGSDSFTDVIRVLPGSANTDTPDDTGSSVGGMSLDELKALLASWFADFVKPTPAPTNTKCAALQDRLAGTVDNAYNDRNSVLQGFLVGEGYSIPALTQGAAWGYKGDQTRAAVSAFKAGNQCL